jgi:Protein of unknown function (DUF551).
MKPVTDTEKKIAEIIRRFDLRNDNGYDHDLDNLDVQILLDELEQACVEIDRLKNGRWISVKERLPENGRRVMVIDKHENQTIAWCEHGRFWPDNLQFSPSMITHWQPLPEPPKLKRK